MTLDVAESQTLVRRLREVALDPLPLPGGGQTPERHRRLLELGREGLSLARLAEAHFDAIAILAEAGRSPQPSALYGVWASEVPGRPLTFAQSDAGLQISGAKMFASGAGIIDRALVTVDAPNPYLIDIDLRAHPSCIRIDDSAWKAKAFAHTRTSTVFFDEFPASRDQMLGDRGWYLSRPGFWHGASSPAACWAGGAIGLVDYARRQSRSDPHTLAHLGALHALAWQLRSCLETAGREIDAAPFDSSKAHIRALAVRHLVEQASSEILHRFARAYGPYPLAFDEAVSIRYQELDIYLRQCHAERDLDALGNMVRDVAGSIP